MYLFKQLAAALCITTLAAFPLTAGAEEFSPPGAVVTIKIAAEAYIYGYPLVTFDTVRMQQTNMAVADAEHAPMGQMINMRSYPAVDNHCCAAPNSDTLYTLAWLDVTDEAYVFSIPDMGDRYYIMPLLDGYSEVFHVASSRINGGKAQTYAITGPGWSGTLPQGVTEVKSPTGMVWICGRIYCTGTAEDYTAAHDLQDKFSLVPLSAYGKPYTAPKGTVDPNFDMKTAVRKQVNGLDIETYFTHLAKLMKTNPPTEQDAPILAKMAKIGLVPGQNFDAAKLGFMDKELLRTVPKLAQLEMGLRMKRQKTTNGWFFFTKGVGDFGTDYLLRGMANLLGPGWNRPEDAVYPISMKDVDGKKYNGDKYNYVVRFEKGELPPADAFWSLTIYDKDFFFAPNSINRFELSQRNSFVTNPDGSIELFIQADSPGKDKEANWLPAPKGKFILVLRLYSPKATTPSILDGSWTPPPVARVKK